MLRITIHDAAGGTTIELEGRIAGPWVQELDRTWRSVVARGNSNGLCVDIRKVGFVDAEGKEVLRGIHRETRARFLADTPLTVMYAEEVEGRSAKNGKGKSNHARS